MLHCELGSLGQLAPRSKRVVLGTHALSLAARRQLLGLASALL